MVGPIIVIALTLLTFVGLQSEQRTYHDISISVLAGIIATAYYKHAERIINWFSKSARHNRYIKKLCSQAILNIDERFGLTECDNSSFDSLVSITDDKYKLCLFETYLLGNHTNGSDRYGEDITKFKDDAFAWYNSYQTAHQLDRIQYLTHSEMNELAIEITSWGESGRPWLLRTFPKIWHLKVNMNKWLYSKRDKNVIVCEYLFRDYKLPRGRAAQLNIELITGKPMT